MAKIKSSEEILRDHNYFADEIEIVIIKDMMQEYAEQFEKNIDLKQLHDEFIALDNEGHSTASQKQIFEWFKNKIE